MTVKELNATWPLEEVGKYVNLISLFSQHRKPNQIQLSTTDKMLLKKYANVEIIGILRDYTEALMKETMCEQS